MNALLEEVLYSEIVSRLLEYLTNNKLHVKRLTCYSDSCFGQNKNTQMISFWEWLIWQHQFTHIAHKYLVRWHTYLPCDRDFALVEKKKESAVVHLPDDWKNIIKEANLAKTFNIQKMSEDNIFDISVIANKFTMRKCLSVKPVLISTASWFNFGGEDGNEVHCSCTSW